MIFAGESPLRLNWRNQKLDQAPFVAATGGGAVWDFPVSDIVASPVIRRAHPTPRK